MIKISGGASQPMDEAFSGSLNDSAKNAPYRETGAGLQLQLIPTAVSLGRAEDNAMSLAQDAFAHCAEPDTTECSLLAMTVTKAEPTPLDPFAQLTFEARPYDVSALPSDEEAAENAALDLKVFRLAADLMRHDHKELERLARQETQALLKLLELIGSQITVKKQDVTTLECVRTRLIVVLSRLLESPEWNSPARHARQLCW